MPKENSPQKHEATKADRRALCVLVTLWLVFSVLQLGGNVEIGTDAERELTTKTRSHQS
jgi:hypothetical protein